MHYVCDLGAGRQIYLHNDGDLTVVSFHTTSPGQQQSQGTGIETGAWTGKPSVFRLQDDLVLRLESARGVSFFSVSGNRITRLSEQPDLGDAKELSLQESHEESPFRPMQAVRPMEPMKPMEPMQPMKPMEMRMGNMSMSMGKESAPATPKKYCTQCGSPLGPDERYCGNCGHKV